MRRDNFHDWPGQDMDELKHLIDAHWRDLTPNQRRVGEFALSNAFLVATMGGEELAAAAGVSTPTVTRFVRALGLAGYADFRAIAIRRFQALLQPVENASRASHRPTADILRESCRVIGTNVAGAAVAMSPRLAEMLVDRMAGAGKVGFLGFGTSARALSVLAGGTETLLRSHEMLDGSGGHERLVRVISRMGAGDLILAMSLPRYSLATVEFLRLARTRGIPCIGVTDHQDAPICAFCDQVLVVPAAHPVLAASVTGAISLFETLTALMTARYQTSSESAAMVRAMFPYLCSDVPGGLATPGDRS